MNWKVEVSLYGLIALGILSAVIEKNFIQAYLFGGVLLLSLFSLHLSRNYIWTKEVVFAGMVAIIFLLFFLSLNNGPILLIAASYFVLILIIGLNLSLYRFLFTQRGIFFSIAVFPFHLLYFFYSLVAFIIAGGIHTLKLART